jgi:hypothetical protein
MKRCARMATGHKWEILSLKHRQAKPEAHFLVDSAQSIGDQIEF